MKILLILILVLNGRLALGSGLGEKFCLTQAENFFKGYHARVLDEIGENQDHSQEVTMSYSQEILDMDNRYETYHFSVLAENDEGDSWVREYKVFVDAWLAAGESGHLCDFIKMEYLGITEQSP